MTRTPELVLVFGPLDPRSSGRAVVTAHLTSELERRVTCRRFDTTPARFGARWPAVLKPLRRGRELAQLVRLLVTLPFVHGRVVTAYIPVNADRGDVVTSLAARAVLAVSRATVYLHHHSFVHAARGRRWMRRLSARRAGRVVHVVGCRAMAERVAEAQHAPRESILEFSIAQLIDDAGIGRAPGRPGHAPPLVLGFMARLEPGKGLPTAIELVKALEQSGTRCHLLVAGRAPTAEEEDSIRALVDQSAVGSYLGALEGETEKAQFFEQLDCYLFPSVYVHETLPATVLEALRSGCPVYAVDRGCVASMLGPLASNGFVQPLDRYVDRGGDVLSPASLARARAAVSEFWPRVVSTSKEQTDLLLQQLAGR